MATVNVIGGGLAGCEAALQLAQRGHDVRVVEMRPVKTTEAHQTANLGELVCTNSFKSEDPANAHGSLKREMRTLGSVLLRSAEVSRVPAGSALAVDRTLFAEAMSQAVNAAKCSETIRGAIFAPAGGLYLTFDGVTYASVGATFGPSARTYSSKSLVVVASDACT